MGCSCTFGLGVDDNDTISSQLSNLTGKEVINMGIIGSSNQFMLDNSLILKKIFGEPYGLIMLWTSTTRFPYYGFDKIRHIGFWDRNMSGETPNKYSNMFDNFYSEKSHEMITFNNILNATRNIWSDKTKYIEGTFFEDTAHYGKIDLFFETTDYGRDLMHPGVENIKLVAEKLNEKFK
jgi:hypothetical protein